MSLMGPIDGWIESWQSRYSNNTQTLDQIIGGRIGFFGHQPLNFGQPVHWHRDPARGIVAPLQFGKTLDYRDDSRVGDIKLLWELGRHQYLIPLAVAYAVTGNAEYRRGLIEQIESWINENPFGLGIHWCSSLEASLRLISWALIHSLLTLRDGKDGFFSSVADRRKLGDAIYQQAWFIRHHVSRYSSANNHLIGELTGLWVACNVFELGPEGRNWGTFAQQELEREAIRQVHDDGVDKEQAIYYHLWVLEYLFVAWLIGKRATAPFSSEFENRIVAMAKFLRDIAPANGDPPQIGDSDNGFVTRFDPHWPDDPYSEVVTAIGHVFSREELLPLSGAPCQKAFWYGMIAGTLPNPKGIGIRIAAHNAYPKKYHAGGYAILGSDTVHIVLKAGPFGYPSIAAHAHADALSIVLALDDEWWLVDPGTYAYHSEKSWRDYFRGTSAHNTITIDGTNQATIGGAFLWLTHTIGTITASGVTPDGNQWVEAEHDGYISRRVLHQRRIEYRPGENRIIVTDSVTGEGQHELAAHFHFMPTIVISSDTNNGGWMIRKSGSKRSLGIEVDPAWHWENARGAEQPPLGWYSSALGQKVPANTLRGRWMGKLPVSLVTVLHIG
jgi:hypothetical protein